MAPTRKQQTYSGAALREQAQRFAAQVDPKAEAEGHEASFLRNMASAKADFDWLVSHSAWLNLGFSKFADWWETRVVPVASGLGMRPTRDVAKAVIETIAEEQKALPREQRRSQRQIAEMVGVGVFQMEHRMRTNRSARSSTTRRLPL